MCAGNVSEAARRLRVRRNITYRIIEVSGTELIARRERYRIDYSATRFRVRARQCIANQSARTIHDASDALEEVDASRGGSARAARGGESAARLAGGCRIRQRAADARYGGDNPRARSSANTAEVAADSPPGSPTR